MESSITLGNLAVWHHPSQLESPRARLLLVHGLHEHSGRHLNTIHFLQSQGVEVTRFDLRGSGKSGGQRQYIDRFEDYLEDTNTVFKWMLRKTSKLPLLLLGHSLGGTIAIHFAAKAGDLLDGLVLSAPAYKLGNFVSPLTVFVGKLVRPAFPGFKVPSTDFTKISRDPEAVKAYKEDPLCCHFFTLQQGNETLKAMEQIPEVAPEITCPTFIVHGVHDETISVSGSSDLLRLISSPHKILHLIPGGYHEPHNDLDKENYFQALGIWIRQRCQNT